MLSFLSFFNCKTSPKVEGQCSVVDWQILYPQSVWSVLQTSTGPEAPDILRVSSLYVVEANASAESQMCFFSIAHKKLLLPVASCGLSFKYLRNYSTASIVIQTCNPSIQEAEAEGSWFEASLGYILRPYVKTKHKKERKESFRVYEWLRNETSHF